MTTPNPIFLQNLFPGEVDANSFASLKEALTSTGQSMTFVISSPLDVSTAEVDAVVMTATQALRFVGRGSLVFTPTQTLDINQIEAAPIRCLFENCLPAQVTFSSFLREGHAYLEWFGIDPDMVAGDFVLSAGWGTTAAVSAITGTCMQMGFTVTSTGTGQDTSTIITIMFKRGFWNLDPIALVVMNGGTGTQRAPTWTVDKTSLVITYGGLAVAAATYKFSVLLMN